MLLLELQRLLASHEINSNARQKACFFSVKRKHKVSDCWQIILFQKTEFQKRKETSFGFMSTLICKLTLICSTSGLELQIWMLLNEQSIESWALLPYFPAKLHGSAVVYEELSQRSQPIALYFHTYVLELRSMRITFPNIRNPWYTLENIQRFSLM